MSFGTELKEFTAAFKSGYEMKSKADYQRDYLAARSGFGSAAEKAARDSALQKGMAGYKPVTATQINPTTPNAADTTGPAAPVAPVTSTAIPPPPPPEVDYSHPFTSQGYAQGGMVRGYESGGAADTEENYDITRQQAIPTGEPPAPPDTPEQADYSELLDPGVTKDALHSGLMFIRDKFGLGGGKAIDEKPSAEGMRAFASNVGAASPREMQDVQNTVDPKGSLNEDMRYIAGLNAVYKFWLQQDRPDKAASTAASILMYSRHVADTAGKMAQVSAQNGDAKTTAAWIEKANSAVPDGKSVKATPSPNNEFIALQQFDSSTGEPVGKTQNVSMADLAENASGHSLDYWQRTVMDAAGGGAGRGRQQTPGAVAASARRGLGVTGGVDEALNQVAQLESGFRNIKGPTNKDGTTDWGPWQLNDGGTLQEWAGAIGVDLSKYASPLDIPIETQRAIAAYGFQTRGFEPWVAARKAGLVGREDEFRGKTRSQAQAGPKTMADTTDVNEALGEVRDAADELNNIDQDEDPDGYAQAKEQLDAAKDRALRMSIKTKGDPTLTATRLQRAVATAAGESTRGGTRARTGAGGGGGAAGVKEREAAAQVKARAAEDRPIEREIAQAEAEARAYGATANRIEPPTTEPGPLPSALPQQAIMTPADRAFANRAERTVPGQAPEAPLAMPVDAGPQAFAQMGRAQTAAGSPAGRVGTTPEGGEQTFAGVPGSMERATASRTAGAQKAMAYASLEQAAAGRQKLDMVKAHRAWDEQQDIGKSKEGGGVSAVERDSPEWAESVLAPFMTRTAGTVDDQGNKVLASDKPITDLKPAVQHLRIGSAYRLAQKNNQPMQTIIDANAEIYNPDNPIRVNKDGTVSFDKSPGIPPLYMDKTTLGYAIAMRKKYAEDQKAEAAAPKVVPGTQVSAAKVTERGAVSEAAGVPAPRGAPVQPSLVGQMIEKRGAPMAAQRQRDLELGASRVAGRSTRETPLDASEVAALNRGRSGPGMRLPEPVDTAGMPPGESIRSVVQGMRNAPAPWELPTRAPTEEEIKQQRLPSGYMAVRRGGSAVATPTPPPTQAIPVGEGRADQAERFIDYLKGRKKPPREEYTKSRKSPVSYPTGGIRG